MLLNRLWLRDRLLMHRLRLWLANRLFNRLGCLRARLCRSIRRLILMLHRLTRRFLLPMAYAGRRIDPMDAHFTHALVVVIIDVVITVIMTVRLHALQWAIAKHRRAFFTAGPKTMYQ
jgi:hypothetical protein